MAPNLFGAGAVVVALCVSAATAAYAQQFVAPPTDSPQEPTGPIPQSDIKRAATRGAAERSRSTDTRLPLTRAFCTAAEASACADAQFDRGARATSRPTGNVLIERWGNNFAPIYVDVRIGSTGDRRHRP